MSSLAILILTKNEEDNIVDVVENAKKCTSEVLVIDSGSTDKTVELAKAHGAKVCFRAWTDDFAAQRNFALTQTDADWVLYLDADERLNEELIAAVRQVIEDGSMDKQYALTRKSVAFGTTFNHGVLYPDHVARFFPRNRVKWVNKVHEHPECDLPLERLPGHIEHHTYKDWHHWEEKLCLYTTIWAEDAYKRGKRTTKGGIFLHSLGGFFKMFVLRAGFLDGWMGTYMCCNHFFYTMLKYLKLHELQQKKGK
ncbi:glycosyltransferase family 2 protein [Megasphaera sp.]|jgi:glycosyltransferase involved in cell wall biosynthesis|uniref:glycosyltransferase family 2 protein n=1 Tax=Megasphaera sp. TaxID=2023260 RepID=UPI00266FFC3F|nr:glycosyltransferase family 2 protein [uncultured Megasphaera sp.]